MPTLLQLPNDVLNLIFDCVPREEQRQTLVSLSQTCRVYLNLLGPKLYRHFVWRSLFLTTQEVDNLNNGPLSPFIKKLTFYALDEKVPSAKKQIPVDRRTHWHPIDFRCLWKKDPKQRNLPDLLAQIEALPNLEEVHIDLPLKDLSEEVDSFLHGYISPKEKQNKEAVYLFAQLLFENLASRPPPPNSSESIFRTLKMYGNMKNSMPAFYTAAWRQYVGSLRSFWHNSPVAAEYSLKEVLYDHLTSVTSLTITNTNPEQLQALLTPNSAPSLKNLFLTGARYDEHLANIILAHAPRLESLSLENRDYYDYQPSLSICFQPSSMPKLRYLRLDDLPIELTTQDFLVSQIDQLETLRLQCYCLSKDMTSTAGEQVSYANLFVHFLSRRPRCLRKLELDVLVWPSCWVYTDEDHRDHFGVCDECLDWGHTEEDYEFRDWFFAYHYPKNRCPEDLLEDLPEDTDIDWAATKAAAKAFRDARAYVKLRRWLEEHGCEVIGPGIAPECLPWDPAWNHGDNERHSDLEINPENETDSDSERNPDEGNSD